MRTKPGDVKKTLGDKQKFYNGDENLEKYTREGLKSSGSLYQIYALSERK